MRNIFLSTAIALTLAACNAAPPPSRIVTLPSGKEVKVLKLITMHSTQGGKWLTLEYETRAAPGDYAAVSREMEEIWPVFKGDVERAGMTMASIKASWPAEGTIIKQSKSHAAAFEKAPDGTWSRMK